MHAFRSVPFIGATGTGMMIVSHVVHVALILITILSQHELFLDSFNN
jgi:hypothetical protein